MKIKYISLKKLQAIKANGYVGEHNKQGKQIDYCDFIAEINDRINTLTESKLTKGSLEAFNHVDMSFLIVDRLIFKKTFNHWAYLAQKLQWGL